MRGSQFAALVVLAALPAHTQDLPNGGSRAEILALAAHSERTLPAEVTQALSDELRRISLAAGLQPEWHQMPGTIEITSVWEPVSVYLHGDCRLRVSQGGGDFAVEKTDGELTPHIHVDCGRVTRFMHREITILHLQRNDLTMGRAIARVVAHELLHYLTRNPEHGDSELFASSMACEVLLKQRVQLLDGEVGELRKATDLARAARKRQHSRLTAGD